MSFASGAQQARKRWTVGASAAAGATGLVAITATLGPTLPLGAGEWADAVINEWIVWFTALYLGLLAIVAIRDRISRRT